MEIIEKLQEIAENRGLVFEMGSEHWQNLLDAEDDVDKPFDEKQVYLLVFTEKERAAFGKFNSILKEDGGSSFLLAVRSRITDSSFKYKYDNHLKPLRDLAKEIRDNDFGSCDDMKLKSYALEAWREDYLDTNLDCVEVRLELETIYE